MAAALKSSSQLSDMGRHTTDRNRVKAFPSTQGDLHVTATPQPLHARRLDLMDVLLDPGLARLSFYEPGACQAPERARRKPRLGSQGKRWHRIYGLSREHQQGRCDHAPQHLSTAVPQALQALYLPRERVGKSF